MNRNRLIQRIRELCLPMEPIPTGVAPRLPSLRGIRSVVFDVYGTLLISGSGDIGMVQSSQGSEKLLAALKDAGFVGRLDQAARHGVELLLEEIKAAHTDRCSAGIDFPEIEIRAVWSVVLGRLHARGWISPGSNARRCERVAVEYECRANPVWPMPGAFELIEELRGRGLLLGIASNAQFYTPLLFPALLDAEISELGIHPDLSVFSYEHGVAKPSPVLFGILVGGLRRCGIAPHETLYVGNDLLNDVAAAADAGLRAALFAGDARSLRLREADPRCRGVEPEIVVSDLRQACDVLAT